MLTMISLVPLQDGGYRYPWKDAHIIAPLIIGVMVLAAFVVWEGWYAQYPMVPKVLLRQRGVVIPLTVAFVAGTFSKELLAGEDICSLGLPTGFAYYSVLSFFPQMLQTLYYQASPTRIGVLSEGYSLGLLFGPVLVNVSLSYVNGHVRWPILLCALLMSKSSRGALIPSP